MILPVNLLPIPLEDIGVKDDQFRHPSDLHGAAHVNRVIFHAIQITVLQGLTAYLPEIWAAAYLHDLSRRHDGICHLHGQWAVEEQMPRYVDFFLQGGINPEKLSLIEDAVRTHCQDIELPENPVAVVLKDADALDRVRLGDLDAGRLRLKHTPTLIPKAEELMELTNNSADWLKVWHMGNAIYKSSNRSVR